MPAAPPLAALAMAPSMLLLMPPPGVYAPPMSCWYCGGSGIAVNSDA